jgi:hypothetical protein
MTMHAKLSMAALTAALVAAPACGDLQNNTVPVDVVAYAPDGTLVLFTAAGIYVFDPELKASGRRIPLDALGLGDVHSSYELTGTFRASLSPDGTAAAITFAPYDSGIKSRAAVYRIADGSLLNHFEIEDAGTPGQGHALLDLALSPGGALLYAFSQIGPDRKANMIDVAIGQSLWSRDTTMRLPVWSPDGTALFGYDYSGLSVDGGLRLQALEPGTGEPRWSVSLDKLSVDGLAVTAAGTMLVAPSSDDGACVLPNGPASCPVVYPFWSTTDGSLQKVLPAVPETSTYGSSPNGYASFACSPNDVCAVGLVDFSLDQQRVYVRVYRTDGSELQRLYAPRPVGSVAVSPDGKLIAVAADPVDFGGVAVFRIDTGEQIGSRIFRWDIF